MHRLTIHPTAAPAIRAASPIRTRARWYVGLAIAGVIAAGGTAAPASAAVDVDRVFAATSGVQVDGYLYWLSLSGFVEYDVTVRDKAGDSRCAELYVRQRNRAVATRWSYVTRACGKGKTFRAHYRHAPLQGGTSGFDFQVRQSSGGYAAYDFNALLGD